MLVYCGITMVKPITELARTFEKREGIKIAIAQGASEDLFQSAKKSRLGDLYLPGEPSFLLKHQPEGLFGEHVIVGYNQIALVVQKGNPKRVKGDVRDLLRKDLVVIIGSSDSGSIGHWTKNMLDSQKIYAQVVKNAVTLSPDSRTLNLAIKRGEADVALNWRATAFFQENVDYLDVIDLSRKIAKPQALYLIALKFSRNPALAERFMNFVASEEGQTVMRKFGFLDNQLK